MIPDRPAISRRITGFHMDAERQWVAELECGHAQHARHDPPWQVREWVTSESGRRGMLGATLGCVLCASAEAERGKGKRP